MYVPLRSCRYYPDIPVFYPLLHSLPVAQVLDLTNGCHVLCNNSGSLLSDISDICQYPVWIVTGSFLEPFHGLCQTGALVIRFERYFFNPSVPFAVKAQIEFCTKFHRCFDFSSDDGTQPRLRDAYDPVFYTMDLVVVHIFLLLIQCSDRQIQTCFFFCCCISVTHELFQIPNVPCNIAKLFSQGFPYFLCTVFFAFGKCQIIFSGAFFITSRQRQIIGLAKTADDRFQFFSRLIQQGNILWVTDIRRSTCRIQS